MFNPNKSSENSEQGKIMEKVLFSSLDKKDVLEFIKEGVVHRSEIVAKKRNLKDSIEDLLNLKNNRMDEEKYRKIVNQSEYLVNWDKYIKNNQPGSNPSEPKATFAFDLFNDIAEKELDLKDEEGNIDYSRLKFYTTINSALDYNKSVDCFFEMYDVDNEGNYIKSSEALVDFTISNNKPSDKQEVILTMDTEDATDIEYYLTYKLKQNPKLKDNLYDKYIKSFGAQVANKLKENARKARQDSRYEFAIQA